MHTYIYIHELQFYIFGLWIYIYDLHRMSKYPSSRFSLYGMWSHIQPFYTSVFDDPTTASFVAFVVIAVGAPACVVGGLLADRYLTVLCVSVACSQYTGHLICAHSVCNSSLCICLPCPPSSVSARYSQMSVSSRFYQHDRTKASVCKLYAGSAVYPLL